MDIADTVCSYTVHTHVVAPQSLLTSPIAATALLGSLRSFQLVHCAGSSGFPRSRKPQFGSALNTGLFLEANGLRTSHAAEQAFAEKGKVNPLARFDPLKGFSLNGPDIWIFRTPSPWSRGP